MTGPRYSLRTIVIIVVIICAYLGAWDATSRSIPPSNYIVVIASDGRSFSFERNIGEGTSKHAIDERVASFLADGEITIVDYQQAMAPCLICRDENICEPARSDPASFSIVCQRRSYFLALWGWKIRLPFETDCVLYD